MRWVRKSDEVLGPSWEAELHWEGGLLSIMVTESESGPGWGFDITDGSGTLIAKREGLASRQEAQQVGAAMLESKLYALYLIAKTFRERLK